MANSGDKALFRRLFVAFLLTAGLALVCIKALPAAGVDVPWYVPVLGFAVILVSVLARRVEEGAGDDEDGDDGDIAGRIGPGGDPDDEHPGV
jgi:hypothetical protein